MTWADLCLPWPVVAALVVVALILWIRWMARDD
jgi:hypothetical protein